MFLDLSAFSASEAESASGRVALLREEEEPEVVRWRLASSCRLDSRVR